MVDADLVMQKSKFLNIFDDRVELYSVEQKQQISIMYKNLDITVVESQTRPTGQSVPFYALYGMITLQEHSYLILVTKANLLDLIIQKQVFQVEQVEFVPLAKIRGIPSQDLKYLNMIKSMFAKKTFYFSYAYDLSQSMQRFLQTGQQINYNPQFTFNKPLIETFLTSIQSLEVRNFWLSPFISGCIQLRYSRLPGNFDCSTVLISRRDLQRSGMRFFQRGADEVINITHHQTYQVRKLFQFCRDRINYRTRGGQLTRGSMPFSWKQYPNLKWNPKCQLRGDRNFNVQICKRHFETQQQVFPNQVLINLIDKKGSQKMLGDYFTTMITQMQNKNIRYVWFDFHHECRKMKYENLSRLIDEIKVNIEGDGFFHAYIDIKNTTKTKIVSLQSGVVRTNCIDCLDRTNVVQSVICRNVILKILKNLRVVQVVTGQAFQVLPGNMEQQFRETWTKNADVMSFLYSGTGALKTDFTLTGKRTIRGALQDGKNAVQRYFLNNFMDGYNQNCIDLLLGKLSVKKQQFEEVITFYVGHWFLPPLLFGDHYSTFAGIQIVSAMIVTFIFSRFMQLANKQLISCPKLAQ